MLKQESTMEFPSRVVNSSAHTEALSVAERRERAMAPTVYCPEREVVRCVGRLALAEHAR